MPREVLDSNHGGDDEQVDERPEEEHAAAQEPEQARQPTSEIEPVQSQNPETAFKPEKIRHCCAFHSNYLGIRAKGFLVESCRGAYVWALE